MFLNSIRWGYLYLFFTISGIAMEGFCGITEFVCKDSFLLSDVKIFSDIHDFKKSDLKSHIQQLPNHKILRIFKTPSFVYNSFGRDSIRFVNRFFRKICGHPVIFDPILVQKTEIELKKWFVAKGFLDVDVSSEVFFSKKKASVIYCVHGNRPYRIEAYSIEIEDSLIEESIQKKIKQKLFNLHTSLVKKGMLFDKGLLDDERNRVSLLMQNRGFFSVKREDFIYYADSVDTNISLKLKLTDSFPLKKFYYDSIFIHLDCDPTILFQQKNYLKNENVIQNDRCSIFFRTKKPFLRTKTILNHCFLSPKESYSLFKKNLTYYAFSNLSSLNNIQIQFVEKQRNDSFLLDCHLLLESAKNQTIAFSLEGTNTFGDFGLSSVAQYTHQNLFSRSEILRLKLKGSYEMVNSLSNLCYVELETGISLSFPDFIPYPSTESFFSPYQESTSFSTEYSYQSHPEYDRTLFSSGINFQWKKKNKLNVYQNFSPLNIDYVFYLCKNDVFWDGLSFDEKYFLYTNRFIVNSIYSYSNDFSNLEGKKVSSFHFNLEHSWNVLRALIFFDRIAKNTVDPDIYKCISFPLYTKVDVNYSNNKIFDKTHSLVWHFRGGIAFPHEKDDLLPLEKRYYSGGANSVRAWRSHELGPGKWQYHPNDDNNAVIEVCRRFGDIKLDANFEYRIKCFWKLLELASFLDAGNVWTIRSFQGQENGIFLWKNFYKEVAIGYGIGFRLDFDYFLIRFDFGEKIYDPAKGKDGWVVFHPNFNDHFAWHVSLGYPF